MDKKLKDLHEQLDIRNQNTKVWIQAETQTRAYCHELEKKLETAVEALEFYSDVKNFGVTVWADESKDGACWYEPAEEHGLGEIYGESNTGDFGLTAIDALEKIKGSL